MIKLIISGNPISSKNAIRSGITKLGRNYTYVKKDIKEYRDNSLIELRAQKAKLYYTNWFIEKYKNLHLPIESFVEVSFLFYCKDNRKRDLINLCQCPCDLLQQANIILNDYLIISIDGSRIMPPDKDNPRTEIFIKILDKDNKWKINI